MKKHEIERRALSGLTLQPRDVCRISRDRKHVTLRHVWPENVDGRVWDRVRAALWSGAQEIANASGRVIDLYSAEGWMIGQIYPEVES